MLRVGAGPLAVVDEHHDRAGAGGVDEPAPQGDAVDGAELHVLVAQAKRRGCPLHAPPLTAREQVRDVHGSTRVRQRQHQAGCDKPRQDHG